MPTTPIPGGGDEIILEAQGLKKAYGKKEVLAGVDFRVTRAGVVAIIGPNGCGKSTLLRCLNLLEFYEHGRVLLRGQVVSQGRAEQMVRGGFERELALLF